MNGAGIERSAVQVAAWRAEADASGRTLAQVACTAMRERLGSRPKPAAQAWAGLHEGTRFMLLQHRTKHAAAFGIKWADLTDAERAAVGAFARHLVADLTGAAGVLR